MKQSHILASLLLTTFAFDANSLLAAEMDTSELDIERTLITEGEWLYRVGKPKINSGNKDGKDWAQVTLPLDCVDQEVLKELNVEKIGTKIQFFLDLDENGRLAKGTNMNINLAKAFVATGLHGESASILNMEGKLVRGNTKQAKADSGAEYNTVVALASDEE
jgi:hypothetical protein